MKKRKYDFNFLSSNKKTVVKTLLLSSSPPKTTTKKQAKIKPTITITPPSPREERKSKKQKNMKMNLVMGMSIVPLYMEELTQQFIIIIQKERAYS